MLARVLGSKKGVLGSWTSWAEQGHGVVLVVIVVAAAAVAVVVVVVVAVVVGGRQ
jgi:hypothetical protein